MSITLMFHDLPLHKKYNDYSIESFITQLSSVIGLNIVPDTTETWLSHHINNFWPHAHACAVSDGLPSHHPYWVMMTPHHVQISINGPHILPTLELTPQEAIDCCHSLNQEFHTIGTFYAPHPQRWYLALNEKKILSPHWSDITAPINGEDSSWWRHISNEIDIYLFHESINKKRKQPINHLHIRCVSPSIQSTYLNQPIVSPWENIITNDWLVQMWAQKNYIPTFRTITKELIKTSLLLYWNCHTSLEQQLFSITLEDWTILMKHQDSLQEIRLSFHGKKNHIQGYKKKWWQKILKRSINIWELSETLI